MNRFHFEIYTDDPKKVFPFYQDVFDWKFQTFEGGPIEYGPVATGNERARKYFWNSQTECGGQTKS